MFFDHEAPGGVGWLHAEAEEAESGLDEYGGGEVAGGNDHEWTCNVGQYMPEDDAHLAKAEAFCCGDVFHLAEDEDLAADESCGAHPHAEADGDEYFPKAFANGEGDSEDEQQGGYGVEYVDEPHNGFVDNAAEVAGYGAEDDAYGERQQHGYHAHCECDTGANEQTGEYVAAIAVGAEPEGAGSDEVLLYVVLLGREWVGKVGGGKEGGEGIGDGVLQSIVDIVLRDEVAALKVVTVDR